MPKSERPQPALGLAIHQLRIKKGGKAKRHHGRHRPYTAHPVSDRTRRGQSNLGDSPRHRGCARSFDEQTGQAGGRARGLSLRWTRNRLSKSLHPARRDSRKTAPQSPHNRKRPTGEAGRFWGYDREESRLPAGDEVVGATSRNHAEGGILPCCQWAAGVDEQCAHLTAQRRADIRTPLIPSSSLTGTVALSIQL